MQETWVQSLGWKDALEKGMATHSRFWPGEFHELYSPWGPKELDMIERLSLFFFFQQTYDLYIEQAFSCGITTKLYFCLPLSLHFLQ